MKRIFLLWGIALFAAFANWSGVQACTGITLHAQQGDVVTARTIEWAAEALHSGYVVVPRGHKQQSFLPDGTQTGKRFYSQIRLCGIDGGATGVRNERNERSGFGGGLVLLSCLRAI